MEKLQQQLDRLDTMKQQTGARFARLDGLKEQLEAVEASVTSPDRAVTVVAGPGGGVKSIRFSEEARKLSPTQLSQVATSTLQQAVARAARQQAEVVQGGLGEDSSILQRVMKTQEQAFGAVPGEDAAPQQAPQPPRPAPPAPPAPAGQPRHAAPRARDDEDDDEAGFGSVFDAEPNRPSPPSEPQRPTDRDDEFLKLYDNEEGW